jgi:hypothetical protein
MPIIHPTTRKFKGASEQVLLSRMVSLETLDYVVREMRSPEGSFYSTQDADSEGQEGKFFVWTVGEIHDEKVLTSRSRERLPPSVIPAPLTRRPCRALFAMDTGPSRWWPWERPVRKVQVPLPQDRGLVDGHAAAYVCDAPSPGRAFACQAPVTEPMGLWAQLEQR